MRRSDRKVMDREGIEEIILLCKTCHIAMVKDGLPYVVPLSFGYSFTNGGTLELYFHSALEGRKIDILKENNRVCFEMADEGESINANSPCELGYYYSSLIGNGEAVFIEDVSEKCEALSLIVKHQSGRDVVFNSSQIENVSVFKIISADYTGKRKLKPE